MVNSGEDKREFSCCSDAADEIVPFVLEVLIRLGDGIAVAGSCGGGGNIVIVVLFLNKITNLKSQDFRFELRF